MTDKTIKMYKIVNNVNTQRVARIARLACIDTKTGGSVKTSDLTIYYSVPFLTPNKEHEITLCNFLVNKLFSFLNIIF